MSTLATPVEHAPAWKQEVNRRLAAHKSRNGRSVEPEVQPIGQRGAGNRGALAAARVAARYANAPSYSQVLDGQAHTAEAAQSVAHKPQASPEPVPVVLQATSGAARPVKTGESIQSSARSSVHESEKQSIAIRRDADIPVQVTESATMRTPPEQNVPMPVANAGELRIVEAAQPIHANLIEFPRELIATHKARPRRAEGPYAAALDTEKQLSIFEVDPGAILTQPPAEGAAAAARPGPEWLGIELSDQTAREDAAYQAELAAILSSDAAAPAADALQLAPFSWRLLAAVVDGALIAGAFLAAALVASVYAKDLPNLHKIELGAAVALTVIGALYQALFSILAKATPGMKYARVALRTFDGGKPTPAQMRGRLGALLLSLLPVGLGVVWALFDEEHLSWHDRLSRTYLRRI